MSDAVRGRLASARSAPAEGERVDVVLSEAGVAIEHILSGHTVEPVEFLQRHTEWVAVLEGAAELDVGGRVEALEAGDWMVIPAGTPHRLVRTTPGTRWLAVHVPDAPSSTGPDDVRPASTSPAGA